MRKQENINIKLDTEKTTGIINNPQDSKNFKFLSNLVYDYIRKNVSVKFSKNASVVNDNRVMNWL